jgi:hypothetical protein
LPEASLKDLDTEGTEFRRDHRESICARHEDLCRAHQTFL